MTLAHTLFFWLPWSCEGGARASMASIGEQVRENEFAIAKPKSSTCKTKQATYVGGDLQLPVCDVVSLVLQQVRAHLILRPAYNWDTR